MTENPKHDDLSVAVLTTSGRWPITGFDSAPVEEKVRVVLDKAAKQLQLAATHDWIATVGTKALNADESFGANGLTTGDIVIDFGPRHGGGGIRA